MADTRPQPSAEPVAIFQAARRAWLAGPTIVRDPETHSVRIGDKEAAAAVIASALEAARLEALEQAVEKLDGIYREMCGQHGADSGEAGAAFYARKTIYELKENTNAG